MKPIFTTGTGKPPAYVSAIEAKGNGSIKIVGRRNVKFSNQEDLWSEIRKLISDRVMLTVGGMSMGSADELGYLMDERNEYLTYLKIGWKNPKEWTIHEMVPNAREWEHSTLEQIMS